jgi:uncharacterized membrane protein YbaN (DUF454 family)
MKSLGLEEEDMPKLLATTPSVFASTIPFLKTKIRFFHLLGIRDERMKMLLQKYPKALSMSVERSLKPRYILFCYALSKFQSTNFNQHIGFLFSF